MNLIKLLKQWIDEYIEYLDDVPLKYSVGK